MEAGSMVKKSPLKRFLSSKLQVDREVIGNERQYPLRDRALRLLFEDGHPHDTLTEELLLSEEPLLREREDLEVHANDLALHASIVEIEKVLFQVEQLHRHPGEELRRPSTDAGDTVDLHPNQIKGNLSC